MSTYENLRRWLTDPLWDGPWDRIRCVLRDPVFLFGVSAFFAAVSAIAWTVLLLMLLLA